MALSSRHTNTLKKTPVKLPGLYKKDCRTAERYQNELRGWNFIQRYIPETPALLSTDEANNCLYFEDIADDGSKALYYPLSNDSYQPGSMKTLFSDMVRIYKAHARVRGARGGTIGLYIDRQPRLETSKMRSAYARYCNDLQEFTINGHAVTIDRQLLEHVHSDISRVRTGMCAPSTGDLHELNIFTNGRVIDFEWAGWNAVATDIATFLWVLTYDGSYFGRRYLKEATPNVPKASPNPFTWTRGTLICRLNTSRKTLLREYMHQYVSQVDLPPIEEQKVMTAFAFRLLTRPNPTVMTPEDARTAFSLANLCMQPGMNLHKLTSLLG